IALRGVSAFDRASIQALTSLADTIHEHRIPAGEVRQRASGKERALYIVGRGAVQMICETPDIRAIFGARSLIGGISSLAEDPVKTRIMAPVPALLLELHIEDLFDVMEDHFDLARSILAHAALERERLMLLVKRSGASAPAISKPAPPVDTGAQQART